jgi:pyridoxal 5'-phosphate synthase pdxT subunit
VTALVGVLALQGDFEAHGKVLDALGAQVREVRVAADLDGIQALVLPGGESTTMTLGIEREGLAPALVECCSRMPVLGTCAGMIMLDRDHLGVLDIRCERNAFGRQVRSFEGDVALSGFEQPFHAVFIRAPWVAEHGSSVSVLAAVAGHPVAVVAGRILAVAFHPEISGDDRLHRWLLGQL